MNCQSMMLIGTSSGDWKTALNSGKIGLPISRQSITLHAPPVTTAPAAPPAPRHSIATNGRLVASTAAAAPSA
jgi:hypothetical protein